MRDKKTVNNVSRETFGRKKRMSKKNKVKGINKGRKKLRITRKEERQGSFRDVREASPRATWFGLPLLFPFGLVHGGELSRDVTRKSVSAFRNVTFTNTGILPTHDASAALRSRESSLMRKNKEYYTSTFGKFWSRRRNWGLAVGKRGETSRDARVDITKTWAKLEKCRCDGCRVEMHKNSARIFPNAIRVRITCKKKEKMRTCFAKFHKGSIIS